MGLFRKSKSTKKKEEYRYCIPRIDNCGSVVMYDVNGCKGSQIHAGRPALDVSISSDLSRVAILLDNGWVNIAKLSPDGMFKGTNHVSAGVRAVSARFYGNEILVTFENNNIFRYDKDGGPLGPAGNLR